MPGKSIQPSLPEPPVNHRPGLGLLAITALLGFAFTVHAWYPGYMTFDAADQLYQVRHLEFTTQHPPMMAFSWWMTNLLLPGPGGFLLWQLSMYWAGLWLIMARLSCRAPWRMAALLLAGLWPYNLLIIGHIWKDVAMAGALLLAYGCLLWHRDTGRGWWLWPMLGFAVYGACMRHNALPAVLPLFVYASWTFFNNSPGSRRAATLGTIVLVALTVLVSAGLNALPVVEKQRLWPTLALWDLAHISVRADEVLMPGFTVGPGMTPDELAAAIEPWTNTTLFSDTQSGVNNGLHTPYSAGEARQLLAAWFGAARDYPGFYLDHRWELSTALYGLKDFPGQAQTGPSFTILPYRDNPPVQGNHTQLNRWLKQVLWESPERWIYDGWVYVLVSMMLLAGSFFIRSGACFEIRLFSSSGLLYTALLPLIAPASDLRFHSWLVLASLIALIFALLDQQSSDSP